MAKKPKAGTFDVEALKGIATATAGGGNGWVSSAIGKPLLDAGLIQVNTQLTNPANAAEVAAKVTDAGIAWLNANAGQPAQNANPAPATQFPILTNVVPPPSRRGAGLRSSGAPKKYPFDQLEVGQSFFVPVSTETPDPLKSLGSAISAANMRYAEETGQTKKAKRAVKGPDGKAAKGADGKIMKELVDVPVYKFNRKFQIRGVEKDKKYGDWVAPETGAVITRVAVE